MQAHEVLQAAAAIVRAGWSEGGANARDHAGAPVALYGAAVGGSSRVGMNPAAVRFSAYGAVAKVISSNSIEFSTNMLWDRLADAARARSPARPGGNNHMHPLIQFNADDERTAEDVAELLDRVAADLVPASAAALEAGRAT